MPPAIGRVVAGSLLAVTSSGCAPRLRPLTGVPAPTTLPRTAIAVGHRRVVFRWQLVDRDLTSRGEGAARSASPDSVRLDFFLAGGVASGAAILIDDALQLPPKSDAFVRRLVPPPPLLWGALGRLALPSLPDTTVRVDGDTLRADIGSPVAWRLTFAHDTLRKLEHVEGGRVQEWVERRPGGNVHYRHEGSRRDLHLSIIRSDDVIAFDPAIWQLP